MAIIPRGAGGSGGGSSVTISTDTPQPIGTAAAGSTGEVSDAGHVHAIPGAPASDPMTGTGWTATVPGTVTVTWGAGKLTLAAPIGTTTQSRTVRDATPFGSTSQEWQLLARVQVTAGAAAGGDVAQLQVGFGADANNRVVLCLLNNGRMGAFSLVGGALTDHGFAAGPSTAEMAAGDLWVRMTRTVEGAFVTWWGIGVAGAVPTVWTRRQIVDRQQLLPVIDGGRTWIESGTFSVALLVAWDVDVLAIRTSWSGSL